LVAFLIFQGIYVLGGIPWRSSASGDSRQSTASSGAVTFNDYGRESGDYWKLTGDKDLELERSLIGDPDAYGSELEAVMGTSVDRAWALTTGRPDVAMAVLDSGIRWHEAADMAELAGRCRLNEGELPPPRGAALWDANGDGVFNVYDYAGDPAVPDLNGNGVLDPQDLIRAFSEGRDNDGNGYEDDICGWDFLEDDNDPWDESDDGGGTRGARWSGAEAGNGVGTPGACPGGMILPVRVSNSTLMDANDFAQGVIFAVDSGAWVVQAELSSFNSTGLGQAAVDYAWSKGVAVIAAAGEDASAVRSYPGGYERALQVNALAASRQSGSSDPAPQPPSYLNLGGATAYGAQTLFSCPSDGSSFEAAARTAGIAALVYSAAEERVRRSEMWRYPGMNTPLSACELKQVLSMNADDVEFSDRPDNTVFGLLDSLIGASRRYPSTTGWDPYFGYGRVNAYRAVQAVMEGRIPPEAEIRSPRWFEPLNPGQVSVEVSGKVAAVRADSYQYSVEYAVGWNPSESDWVSAYGSSPRYEPYEGVLATLDLGKIYGAVQDAPQERDGEPDPNRYAFSVRVRVRDDRGNWGEDRRVFFCFNDADAYPGTPWRMGSGVASSPRLADLDDDGLDELVLADQDGYVHALRRDYSELEGWPVHVTPLALHLGSRGFSNLDLPQEAYGSITGTPAVGDLDHDGDLEVVVGDTEGRIYAWDNDGRLLPGFPVRSNPLYSIPDRADWMNPGALPADWYTARAVPDRVHRLDRSNCLDRAFLTGPVLSNLDHSIDGSLEIIAACQDRHLYVWHMDGTPLDGWPVKLADGKEVSRFDPLTHVCEYADGEGAPGGAAVVGPPSVGDLNGDGRLEVVCGSGELFGKGGEVSPLSCGALSLPGELGASLGNYYHPASTRLYALHGDGTAHGRAPGAPPPAEGLPAQACLQGWPVSLPVLFPGVLSGSAAGAGVAAAIADVDGGMAMEVGISTACGPAFLLEPDGTSHLGRGEEGLPLSLRCDVNAGSSKSDDAPVLCAPAAGCFADLGNSGLSYVAPTLGLGRIMDIVLPAEQERSHNQLSAWSSVDGSFLAPFPVRAGGMAPKSSPLAVDVDGDASQEVIAGGSYCDLRCFGADGAEKGGWPKFTAGDAATPVAGDFDSDGYREVITATREGWLLVWKTASGASDPADWPEYGHDPCGTSCLESDARRPTRVMDLKVEVLRDGEKPVGIRLEWSAPGDDGLFGQVLCYDIRCLDRPLDGESWKEALPLEGKPLPGEAGSVQEWIIEDLSSFSVGEGRTYYFALQARDEAGNLSAVSNPASVSF
jgi:hypothetical protein